MTSEIIPFKRYIGAFNNINRMVFGTDYLNGEVGEENDSFYSLVAIANVHLAVWLSKDGDVRITVAQAENDVLQPQYFADPSVSDLEDSVIQNATVQVAAEMADAVHIRELHFGRDYWSFISKYGIDLPPGWDFTNTHGGEIHLERG